MDTRAGPLRGRRRGALPLALLGLLLLAPLASASEVRSGELVRVGPDEVVREDLYAFGRRVEVLGRVEGDLVAFGAQVEVRGAVEGDVLAAAGTLSVSGPVAGSARLAGGEVAVGGPVRLDVLAAARTLALSPPGRVGGDVLVAASGATLGVPVGGEVRAAAETLVLSAPVAQGVRADVGALRLTPGARIGGPLVYASREPVQLPPGAVQGPVERQAPEGAGLSGPAAFLYGWLRAAVGLVLLGVLLAIAAPRLVQRTPSALRQSPWGSLGWGTLALVGTPVAALLLFLLGVLVGGWWLGLVLLALLVLAVLACLPLVGLTVGQWALTRVGRARAPLLVALVVGVVLLTLAFRVPVLGPLALLVAVLFGLGALLRAGVHLRRTAA